MKFLIIASFILVTSIVYAATSKENRAKQNFEITAQHGFNYSVDQVSQVGLAYFINQDNQIGIKAGKGESGDDKQTNITLQFKHYAGNSFYLAPEVFYLNYFEDDDSETFFDNEKEKITGIGVGVRIGNQWQWDHFTIGCDWLGISGVVAHWSEQEDSLNSPVSFTFVNAYLGFSF